MAQQYIKGRHDIGLLRQDKATKIGFMLALNKNVPAYAVYDDEYLAEQFFTGSAGYSSLPSEKEIADRQDDWRSGFGLRIYDANDPKRYHKSLGMDMRHQGMAMASWGEANIATPKEIRYSFTGNAGTNTVAWKQAPAAYDSNISTYAIHNIAGAPTSYPLILQSANINCEELSILAEREVNGAGLYVGIYNHDLGGWQSIVTNMSLGTYGWHTLKFGPCIVNQANIEANVSVTAASWFRVREVYLKAYAMNGGGDIYAHAKFNDNEYFACNTVLAKLNATGSGLTPIRSYENRITAIEPFIDDKLYIGFGFNAYACYRIMNTSEGIVAPPANANTTNCFQFLRTIHTASPTLYGNDTVHTIRSSTTPSNAQLWSVRTNVSSSYYNITKLLPKAGALYIMKEDMPYYLDSVGAVQNDLAPELENNTSLESGKHAYVWQNKIYMQGGGQTFIEIDGSTITYLNPADYCTNLPEFTGRIDGLTAMDRWLFIILRNETDNQNIVMAGRDETIDSSTAWTWHPLLGITMSNAEMIFTSDVHQKRLYIASTNSADPLRYIPLPKGYGDLANDDNRSFKSGGYFWSPYLHANFKGDQKAYYKLITTMAHNYNANRYFEAHYRTLENATWTKIGYAKGTDISMLNTLPIPLDGAENEPVSTMMQLNFCVNTDDHLETPILLDYDVRSILRPPKRNIIVCTVRVGDDIMDGEGVIAGQASEYIEALDEARSAKWPVTFYDPDGNRKDVILLPLPKNTPRWYFVRDEKDRVKERHYNLMLQEVLL